jgi:Na+/H+ antiporter NhaD/arsenite permease-like protein
MNEPTLLAVTPAAAIVVAVFVMVAVRRIGPYRLRFWQIMALGAIAMLAFSQLTPAEALRGIDFDVMFFLFGVFVMAQAAEMSGELEALSFRLFRRARTAGQLILLILFGLGGASALLMNDTLAIAGTPVVIALARTHGMPERVPLLALAFAVTIGSVPSPIGNPQNLIVALRGGLDNPFYAFAAYLLVPTLLNLGVAYFALRLFERDAFHSTALTHTEAVAHDPALARIARAALALFVALIVARLVLVAAGTNFDLRLTYIALAPAGLVLIASRRRWAVGKGIDWATLAFFAALFIVVEGMSQSGLTTDAIDVLGDHVEDAGVMLWLGAALSQLVSNVPLVAIALPVVTSATGSDETVLALAAGATVAGNFTILAAASNVIIFDNAERRFGVTVSLWQFMRIGVPLTIANLAVHQAFFLLL